MGKIHQRLQNTYKYELLGSMRKNVMVPVKAKKTQPPKVLIKKISEEGNFFRHDNTRPIRLDSIVKKQLGSKVLLKQIHFGLALHFMGCRLLYHNFVRTWNLLVY